MTLKFTDSVLRACDTAALADRMVSCISDVSAWMKSNRLQLNTAKTVCGVRQIDSSI